MRSEVYDGILVGGSRVVNFEILALERVADDGRQRAGESLISIRTDISEFDSVRNLLRRPDHLVEAFGTAVQSVRPVVFRSRIRLTVQNKLRSANAVAVAADQGAEERTGFQIAIERVVSQNHV